MSNPAFAMAAMANKQRIRVRNDRLVVRMDRDQDVFVKCVYLFVVIKYGLDVIVPGKYRFYQSRKLPGI
tara:strand:- start:907 stop:1113 length:207 start_codon:yes stop_codon:yes gene_type:complete